MVDPGYAVRRYLVFGIRTGSDRRRTALVGYHDTTDAVYLRGWLAGARSVRSVTLDDAGGEDAALPIVSALRWLDPARGTVVYPADEPGV